MDSGGRSSTGHRVGHTDGSGDGGEFAEDECSKDSSWIELATADSECGSSFTLLTDAQLRSSASSYRGSRQSPKSGHSANALELNTNLVEKVKYQLVRELAAERLKTAWMQDWSSRPEAVPPVGYPTVRKAHIAFTPPNSPYYRGGGGSDNEPTVHRFSLRHSKLIRHEWFSVEVISVFVCGHVLSFIVGLCIGLCLCRKGIAADSLL